METCLRGFSNSFMPHCKPGIAELKYIESSELDSAWKVTRRQRLKQQETRIWDEFINEQDIISSIYKDDPYQFLEQLPEEELKELMNLELRKMKGDDQEEEKEPCTSAAVTVSPPLTVQAITFPEVSDTVSDCYQVFVEEQDIEEDDEGSGCEEREVMSAESTCTVRPFPAPSPRDPRPETNARTDDRSDSAHSLRPSNSEVSGNKSADTNITNMIENSIYQAKVKELRFKVIEEVAAFRSSIEKAGAVTRDPAEMQLLCRRAGEFSSRFQRIHLYQLQRQIHDIARHRESAPPYGKHTQFQAQLVRMVSLHQNILQAFQVFHNSLPRTGCVRDAGTQLAALVALVKEADGACRACEPPHHATTAQPLYTDDVIAECESLGAALRDYTARVNDAMNRQRRSPTSPQRSLKLNKDKKRATTAEQRPPWARKQNKPAPDTGRLSMYTVGAHLKSKHSSSISVSRRPLMRDPHVGAGGGGPRPPRPRPRTSARDDITTMVEAVEPSSSQLSEESISPKPERKRTMTSPRLKPPPNSHSKPPSPRLRDNSKPVSLRNAPVLSRIKTRPVKPYRSTKAAAQETESGGSSDANEMCWYNTEVAESGDSVREAARPKSPNRCGMEAARPAVSVNRGAAADGVQLSKLLQRLCSAETKTSKLDRSQGAKNAQLLFVNGSSPRQHNTPQLLRILEETIQKKVPQESTSGKTQRAASRLRMSLNIPEHVKDAMFQYRTKFVQQMLASSMYANGAVGKPWEVIGSVSEQIINQLLLKCAREMMLDDTILNIYRRETTD